MQNARAERLFLLIKPIVLWRSRCRCRRRYLSSLLVPHNGVNKGLVIMGFASYKGFFKLGFSLRGGLLYRGIR